MKASISCDKQRGVSRNAKDGIDITVKTDSGHKIVLAVREHGIRLVVDDKEQADIDFVIKSVPVNGERFREWRSPNQR